MSPHLLILPILIPLFTGALLLFSDIRYRRRNRLLSGLSILLQLIVALYMLWLSDDDTIRTYSLGNWQAPYGIVLVLDRLAAYMLTITVLLGTAVYGYACAGQDSHGSNFHALLQFQLLGINGAFLTGDIFNLFVFFEILLISSYALLLHAGGRKRTLAAMHYVVLNVAASTFFLVAVGTLYGTLGSLNMADLAVRINQLDPHRMALVESAGLVLLVVFLLKAAILPLHFWLTRAYAAAPGSVAALFAIMTKVGIYAILRVYGLIFHMPPHDALANFVQPWLWWLGLGTVTMGIMGVIAARNLNHQICNFTLVSVGTLVATQGMGKEDCIAALLFYIPHTTFLTAALFMLAEVVGQQRGRAGTRFVESRMVRQPRLLSAAYLLAVLGILGMPPLSGALAKGWILSTAPAHEAPWLWTIVLLSTLAGLISASRAGTTLFWKTATIGKPRGALLGKRRGIALWGLMSSTVLIACFAGPLSRFDLRMAGQLLDASSYAHAVLGQDIILVHREGAQ